MTIKPLFFTLAIAATLFSCKSDDESNGTTSAILSEIADKSYRISEAELTNSNGTFNISNNYNTKDDELLFKTSGTLEWKPRYDINFDATSEASTLNQSYGLVINSTFNFTENSSPQITGLDNKLVLTVVDANTLTGTYKPNSSTTLTLTLTTKLAQDFASAPQSPLNFEELFLIEGNLLTTGSLDLFASFANNSIYYSNTDEFVNPNNVRAERIIKYDIDNGQTTERYFYQADFVTKRMAIDNNKLVVFGGQFTNTYNLNLSQEPTTTNNAIPYSLSRFALESAGDYAYIVGGDFDNDIANPPRMSNAIQKVDLNTNSVELFAELPSEKFHCGTAIVDTKLYTFSGSAAFAPIGGSPDGPTTDIFVTDLTTGTTSSLSMSFKATNTYAVANEHLIYVAGTEDVYDTTTSNATFIETVNHIGVFNTLTNTFTDLEHNLADPNQTLEVINGLAYLNNKLYIISGSYTRVGDPLRQQSYLVEAVIN